MNKDDLKAMLLVFIGFTFLAIVAWVRLGQVAGL